MSGARSHANLIVLLPADPAGQILEIRRSEFPPQFLDGREHVEI